MTWHRVAPWSQGRAPAESSSARLWGAAPPFRAGHPLRGLWRLVHSRHSIHAGWTNTHSDFNALFSEGLSGIAPKGASQIAQLS